MKKEEKIGFDVIRFIILEIFIIILSFFIIKQEKQFDFIYFMSMLCFAFTCLQLILKAENEKEEISKKIEKHNDIYLSNK